MRDKDNFREDYDRGRYGRGYRRDEREGEGYREGYQSREGYYNPAPRENYREEYRDRERYDQNDYGRGYEPFDRTAGREPEDRYEPRYPQQSDRADYSERNRQQFDYDRGANRGYGRSYETGRSYLRCRDIMTRDVVACRKDSNLREVAKVMREEDTGALPVIDEHNKVIGMITDRDIVVRILAEKDKNLDACTVADAMTDDVYNVRPNDRLVDGIRKMGDKQVRRIIVTDDNGRLKGIISMSDVATEAEFDRELADALEEISKPRSWFKRLFS